MNALSANTTTARVLQNATGYPQDACQKVQSETEITRHDIENAQAGLGSALDDLMTTLAPVMHEANEKLAEPSALPPSTTALHGWLCGQLYLLRSHIDKVRTITSRVEV